MKIPFQFSFGVLLLMFVNITVANSKSNDIDC